MHKSMKQFLCLSMAVFLLAGCTAVQPTAISPTNTELPTNTPTALPQAQYEPIDASLCQQLQESAAQALGVAFSANPAAPFTDTLAGESGQGCRLTASGTGKDFTSLQQTMTALVNSVALGWDPLKDYQADGPTGTDSAYVRDMGLMLISIHWEPAAGVSCPADQPISACNLTTDQQVYTVQIDIAQYKADFSLDGKWEDPTTGFTLNLNQEWKLIYGGHTVVAQNGNKIDALEASISGTLKGKTADVQFKSSFTDSVGTARITYIDVKTLQWKVLTPPTGENYFPAEATLTRK
jgi:hypothetical protein